MSEQCAARGARHFNILNPVQNHIVNNRNLKARGRAGVRGEMGGGEVGERSQACEGRSPYVPAVNCLLDTARGQPSIAVSMDIPPPTEWDARRGDCSAVRGDLRVLSVQHR